MRPALAIGFLSVAVLAASCGKPSRSATTATLGETASTPDGLDTTLAFSVAITHADVKVPAGALDEGARITLTDAVETPEQFQQEDIPAASSTVKLSGVNGAGQELVKIDQAMTVAIDLSSVAALEGVEKLVENLCAFGLGAGANFMVWRHASLIDVDEEDGRATFLTRWFGHYQLTYCGNAELPGANAVAADGESFKDKNAPKDSYGACDLRESAGLAYSMCYQYTGLMFGQEKYRDTPTTGCASFQKTFDPEGTCPGDGVVGQCVFYGTTTYEHVLSYYETDTVTAEDVKAHCAEAKGSWYEPDAFEAGQNTSEHVP